MRRVHLGSSVVRWLYVVLVYLALPATSWPSLSTSHSCSEETASELAGATPGTLRVAVAALLCAPAVRRSIA